MKKISLLLFGLLGFLSTACINFYKTSATILGVFGALVSINYARAFCLLICKEYDFNKNNRLKSFSIKASNTLLLNV